MGYDVWFVTASDDTKPQTPVGDDWINHTTNTAAMIKEVCGSYPSQWYGKKCADMIPILEAATKELLTNPDKYRQYEPGNSWGTVESTATFLTQILANCKEHPSAELRVDC